MKIYKMEIDNCWDCPNSEDTEDTGIPYCQSFGDFGNEDGDIPPWCPLPDSPST